MTTATCWGIFREVEHSPGREADDAGILQATGRRLEEAGSGWRVDYRAPATLTGDEPNLPALAFAMCEGEAALESLGRWESPGVRVVNSARSIANTHREASAPLLAGQRIPVPESRSCSTAARLFLAARRTTPSTPPAGSAGHRAQDARGRRALRRGFAAVEDALEHLRGRGLSRAVAQRHVEGDLVKFYGVSPAGDAASAPSWFEWFYPKERRAAGHAFDALALCDIAGRAAAALALDVWGGDAIVTPAGAILVIDVNAWPSFALYRDAASEHIATHLAARLNRAARVAV